MTGSHGFNFLFIRAAWPKVNAWRFVYSILVSEASPPQAAGMVTEKRRSSDLCLVLSVRECSLSQNCNIGSIVGTEARGESGSRAVA
jgi:hypothetical protein